MKRTAYIALGSNVEPCAETLMSALKLLDDVEGIEVRQISQFLRTSPVGGPAGQDDYLNGAAGIVTGLCPEELLKAMQDVETALGRDRTREERWGSRACDLDLLLLENVIVETDSLTIPHPRMHERAFVLKPLSQIAPDTVHPVLGKTVRELLASLEGR